MNSNESRPRIATQATNMGLSSAESKRSLKASANLMAHLAQSVVRETSDCSGTERVAATLKKDLWDGLPLATRFHFNRNEIYRNAKAVVSLQIEAPMNHKTAVRALKAAVHRHLPIPEIYLRAKALCGEGDMRPTDIRTVEGRISKFVAAQRSASVRLEMHEPEAHGATDPDALLAAHDEVDENLLHMFPVGAERLARVSHFFDRVFSAQMQEGLHKELLFSDEQIDARTIALALDVAYGRRDPSSVRYDDCNPLRLLKALDFFQPRDSWLVLAERCDKLIRQGDYYETSLIDPEIAYDLHDFALSRSDEALAEFTKECLVAQGIVPVHASSPKGDQLHASREHPSLENGSFVRCVRSDVSGMLFIARMQADSVHVSAEGHNFYLRENDIHRGTVHAFFSTRPSQLSLLMDGEIIPVKCDGELGNRRFPIRYTFKLPERKNDYTLVGRY